MASEGGVKQLYEQVITKSAATEVKAAYDQVGTRPALVCSSVCTAAVGGLLHEPFCNIHAGCGAVRSSETTGASSGRGSANVRRYGVAGRPARRHAGQHRAEVGRSLTWRFSNAIEERELFGTNRVRILSLKNDTLVVR